MKGVSELHPARLAARLGIPLDRSDVQRLDRDLTALEEQLDDARTLIEALKEDLKETRNGGQK